MLAVGPGPAADLVLDLGAHHPSTHGGLRLAVTLDGEVVTAARPVPGQLHRGAEKLFEVRDYRQLTVLVNRHDWLSAFANEIGVVTAVETLLGLEVPARATWIRTLLAELNRVLSHLLFLGAFPAAEPAPPPPVGHAAREALLGVMEEVSGGRMHYMLCRVGGLVGDLPLGWAGRCRQAVAGVRAVLPDLAAVLGSPQFTASTRGVGMVSPEQVRAYGLSGPVARASGVALDLRVDEPYLAYGELDVPVVRRTEGDALARCQVLLAQTEVALELAGACLDRLADLPPGPVNVRLPKVLRPPEGSVYRWTENPLGIMGYYLISRAEPTPWRLHLRTPSFNNVQVLGEIAVGHTLAQLVPLLASLFFVVGDIDR